MVDNDTHMGCYKYICIVYHKDRYCIVNVLLCIVEGKN